jgi:hypothetical protein
MDPLLNNIKDLTVSSEDTITLSSFPWSNTIISGGGYTVSSGYGAMPNASVSASSFPYITTGSNTTPLTIGTSTGINAPWYSNSASPKIRLNGEGADIEINGESMIGMLKRIEERLNILTPNEKLEAEWEELRELGEKYRELEKHIKEKQATWDRLKAMPPPPMKE